MCEHGLATRRGLWVPCTHDPFLSLKSFSFRLYRNFSPSCRGHWLLRLAVSLAQLSQSSPLAPGRRVPPTTVLNVVSRGERFATELNPLPDTFLRPSAPPCARGPFVTSCFPPLPPPALHLPLPPTSSATITVGDLVVCRRYPSLYWSVPWCGRSVIHLPFHPLRSLVSPFPGPAVCVFEANWTLGLSR